MQHMCANLPFTAQMLHPNKAGWRQQLLVVGLEGCTDTHFTRTSIQQL